MNTLNIAICEDDTTELNRLLNSIQLSNVPTNCTTFDCGEKLLENYKLNSYDLIIMDIFMNGITGIETINKIRKVDTEVLVAFTTTSLDYTLESYRLNAIKYIEKPVKNKDIFELLDFAQLKAQNKPCLTVKKNNESISIPYSNIIYIEQQGRTLLIHIIGNNIIEINDKIDKLESQFDNNIFLRCHKSYLVNLNYIKSIDKELSVFVMTEGGNVHIRRESMSQAKKAYEDHLFNKSRE